MGKEKLLLLPIGCREGHGVLPSDTDTLITRAFCRLVQKKTDVQVGREITDGFCPTTFRLDETKSDSFLNIFTNLKQTIAQYHEEGFHYLILVNVHGGNDAVLRGVVEDYFQDTGRSVLYFNPYTAFAEELNRKYFNSRDNSFKEISLYLAARQIMGMRPFSGPAYDEEAGRDPLLEKLRRAAVVGFSYTKPAQHIAWRSNARAEIGIRYLKEMAGRFISLLQDFKQYINSGVQYG